MKLTSDNVHETVMHCLYKMTEVTTPGPPADAVLVEGVANKMGFHPGRLEEKKADILSMLEQIPERFKEGCSFLELCMDKEGNQWAEHSTVDVLMILGQAVNLVACLLPRPLWGAMPGGMPYYQFFPEGVPPQETILSLLEVGGYQGSCHACNIEAEIGTEEVPHPVDSRIHTCKRVQEDQSASS